MMSPNAPVTAEAQKDAGALVAPDVEVAAAEAAQEKELKANYLKSVSSDEWAYTFGVVNVMFSSWLAGWKPWCFWCFHAVKMIFALGYKLAVNAKKNRQYLLLDYCYTINMLSIIYYAFCLAKANIPAFNKANDINFMGPIVFRCLFTVCVGPLALSIVMFRNSLVFHNWEQVAVLAVHWSPNLALWGMRWWPNELLKEFPDTFHFDCENVPEQKTLFFSKDDCKGTFVQLWVYPLVSYILLWSIPYALFFFYCGKGYLERNQYHTMYEDMKDTPMLKGLLNTCGGKLKHTKYMLAHGTACSIAFLVGPILWHSFHLHTIYLLTIFFAAIRNGGTFYFRVFAKKYYAQHILNAATALTAEEQREAQSSENEELLQKGDVGIEETALEDGMAVVASAADDSTAAELD